MNVDVLSRFEGIHIPLTTPFRDAELDLSALTHNLRLYEQTPLRGFLVLGSTGEFATLHEEEKAEVLQTAREAVSPDRTLLFGISSESTYGAIQQGQIAQRLGADATLLGIPTYYAPAIHDEDLYRHYVTVADSLEIPVLLYNVPLYTKRDLCVDLVARLSEHPNIIGMKESGPDPDRHEALVRGQGDEFPMLCGNAKAVSRALALGYRGAILAVGNIAPEVACAIFEAHRLGQSERVLELQGQLDALAASIQGLGIGAIKRAMDWRGLQGGLPRAPLHRLSEGEESRLRATLAPWIETPIGES